MTTSDDLLSPIPGLNPAGTDLRYDPLYDKIKEARREDDDAPQGEWQRERKVADPSLVITLASEALATRSKDLQIAAWLTEAMLRRDGFPGLSAGLDLLHGLLERFWDHLYPALEDGDAELRATPLEWVGLRLELAVRSVPIDQAGHTLLKYVESRVVGSEAAAAAHPSRQDARQRAIVDGKLTAEEFDQGFAATPKAWYKVLVADLTECTVRLESLDTEGQSRFGAAAPSYSRLREALADVQQVARQLLAKKLELEPDPPDPAAIASGAAASTAARQPEVPRHRDPGIVALQTFLEPSSQEEAASHVVTAARYLRRADPRNPASYLLLRGFRWGELRAQGNTPDPKLLEAAPTAVRTQLKHLLLDGKWAELLEAAEGVMGTPQGRGWLDLQRYTLSACAGLGSDYRYVASAIRGELKALLTDMPQLVDMALMDDTSAANAETQAWLRDSVLKNGGALSGDANGVSSNGVSRLDSDAALYDARGLALSEVRAGHPEKAIELLMRELGRERSRRGRFLRQTQLAGVMVDAGLEPVAMPILEELLAQIEAHKLEEWETGDVIAQPVALLYRCLDKLDGEANAKHALYLRVCRLDPLQAIRFARH